MTRPRASRSWRWLAALLVAALAGLPGDAEAKRKKRPPDRSSQRGGKKASPPLKPQAARPAAPAPSTPAETPAPAGAGSPPPEVNVADRIEFDERAIGGQTARPGTVRLFERRDSDLRSMVHTRRGLRGAIVRSILGRPPAAKDK
jgi:hypothetical protein